MNFFPFTSSQPILNKLNNGTLNSSNTMPFKERSSHVMTHFNTPSKYIPDPNNMPPPSINIQKKWIGGNNDSSEISRKNRVNAIGTETFNKANRPISINTNHHVNVINHALARARAGGTVAHKKVTKRYMLSVTPSTPPSAPTIDSITHGNASLTVTFTSPVNNGGANISNYAYSTDNGTTWQSFIPSNNVLQFTITTLSTNGITPLTNGFTYSVMIKAANINGYGLPSNMLSGIPSTTPSAPTITSITPRNASLTVNFTSPVNNGGDSILNYAYSTDNGTSWLSCNPPDITSPITITTLSSDGSTPLTNGTTYSVRINAANINGYGSSYSNMITGTPQQVTITVPTLTYILPGNGEIYVYFTAGSGTILNYDYTTDDGNTYTSFSPSITTTPVCITGLTNGNEYTIKLRSNTTDGNSGWSNSLSATPINQSVPAEWLFYDPNDASSYNGSGTSVFNIGNYGTMTGTKHSNVGWQNGSGSIVRKVFNFPGTNYANHISFGSFDFSSNFTISTWVYPSYKGSINGILSNVGPNVGTQGFKAAWNTWSQTGTADRVMLFESGGSSEWVVPGTVQNVVTFGEWQYLTYAFHKKDKRVIFYKNGIPMSVGSITTATNVVASNPFYIGSYYGGSYAMKAEMGLLKVFNSTLDAGQVLRDFNNTKGSFGFV